MFALPEQLLPEVAGHHRSAVTIHPVGEVLAGETDPGPLPVLKLFCVDVAPLLHRPSGVSTSVLSKNSVAGQVASEKVLISCRRNSLCCGCWRDAIASASVWAKGWNGFRRRDRGLFSSDGSPLIDCPLQTCSFSQSDAHVACSSVVSHGIQRRSCQWRQGRLLDSHRCKNTSSRSALSQGWNAQH